MRILLVRYLVHSCVVKLLYCVIVFITTYTKNNILFFKKIVIRSAYIYEKYVRVCDTSRYVCVWNVFVFVHFKFRFSLSVEQNILLH